MIIKILVCIGIIAIMAFMQLCENRILDIDIKDRQLTPVGWLKFGFFLFLIWKWVGTFGI